MISMKSTVFWAVTLCGLERAQCFGGKTDSLWTTWCYHPEDHTYSLFVDHRFTVSTYERYENIGYTTKRSLKFLLQCIQRVHPVSTLMQPHVLNIGCLMRLFMKEVCMG